ncbi:MAG TPA: hypothetical protein VG168_14030 [Bryobacteraceae bacterium]|jgi:hypothetical protein|nr:hypothetical protein [Bryobacteraceae bacterium]
MKARLFRIEWGGKDLYCRNGLGRLLVQWLVGVWPSAEEPLRVGPASESPNSRAALRLLRRQRRFLTIQQAIDRTPDEVAQDARLIIHIKAGTYHERVNTPQERLTRHSARRR